MQLLRKLLFPISLLYGMVVHIRNYLYDIGVFKSNTFKTPTICVGNLSVGGTGKTPMIEYLVRLFEDDFKIAVLSRGYKRKSEGFQLAGKTSTVLQLGDEPYQIHKKFDKIALAVDTDRTNGIVNLEQLVKPDIILLDDAFQHRKVSPMFNILLTAYDKLYIKDVFLPTGSLRDAKNQACRAHVIIVTKCPASLNKSEMTSISNSLGARQKLFFTTLSYAERLKSSNGDMAFSGLTSKKISLVTGIANAKPLVSYLSGLGVVFEHFEFKDHHFFSEKDIAMFHNSDFVITTEKDYVRLKGKVKNLFYIEVRHRFLNGGDAVFDFTLNKALKHHLQSLS